MYTSSQAGMTEQLVHPQYFEWPRIYLFLSHTWWLDVKLQQKQLLTRVVWVDRVNIEQSEEMVTVVDPGSFCFDQAPLLSSKTQLPWMQESLIEIKQVKSLPKPRSPARTVQLCWCWLCELWYPVLPTRSSVSWDICERQWHEVGHFWFDQGSAAFYSSIKKKGWKLHWASLQRTFYSHVWAADPFFFSLSYLFLCVCGTNKCSQPFFCWTHSAYLFNGQGFLG